VLEGKFSAVQRTFERIQSDQRHDDIVLLVAQPIEARMFGEWAMALASTENPDTAGQVLRAAMLRPGEDSAVKLADMLNSLVKQDEWAPA
jgi:FAD-dependent sensor of blue light